MIKINLDLVMLKKKMSSKELAKKIGITPTNLSILKTGKAKGVRFETLDKICQELDCQPGDILSYQNEDKNQEESIYEQVFELINEMYDSLSEKPNFDTEVLKALMVAGKNLNEGKLSPQVIAGRTVNDIIFANMNNGSKLDKNNTEHLNQLLRLSHVDRKD